MDALCGREALIALQSKCCKYRIVARRWHSPEDFGSLEAKPDLFCGARNPGGRVGISVVRPSSRAVAGSGTVKFDIPHRVRAVYGRQLGIAGVVATPTWRCFTGITPSIRSRAARSLPGGQAEVDAMRFQQSLDLT
jgi:hypothetical protein